MSGEVGRCGSEMPRLLGGPPLFCSLRAGHAGWHQEGEASWSAVALIAAARPAAGDARTDRERLREAITEAVLAHKLVAGSNAGVCCLCGWVGPGDNFDEHRGAAPADTVLALAEMVALLDTAEKWHEHERRSQ